MSLTIKRLAAPRSWAISRKTGGVFVAKPLPGPHPVEASLPLVIILRDILKVCDTMGQASRIIQAKDVLVDGKAATSYKQGVGFMDVVSIPKLEQHHRVLLDKHGRLTLVAIDAAAAGWKFSRIEGKTTVAGGKIQLNLHDGRNLIVKEHVHKTGDVLKLKLPEQKVLAHYKLGEGATAMVTGGKHAGQIIKVASVETTTSPKPNLVQVRAGEETFATIRPYVFVVGQDKPEITLPGVM